MTCPFYHKLCGSCKKYVCRAYFPEKQPYITNTMMPVCAGDNYEHECLIYADALAWREERKRRSLNEHCPFAYNTFCGKPWLWVCKGVAPIYFPLTEVEVDHHNIPLRDEEGKQVFKLGKSIDDIKGFCLSGDTEIYENCPNYKSGVEYNAFLNKLKRGAN